MKRPLILLSVPALRERDLARMPRLHQLAAVGSAVPLVPAFPAVTCPVQATMTTGRPPSQHGVVGNGFFWRDRSQVEMWTAWNDCIQCPQIWDRLHERGADVTSAVWFAMHSKGCGADYVCTPAPVHHPDGSESLWCYTKPESLYGSLRDRFGDFPLQHFWGPTAGIASSRWIVDSALHAAAMYRPEFFMIYVPHLDYAAQKTGPHSEEADRAAAELDSELGRLIDGVPEAYGSDPVWLVVSEYTMRDVRQVALPNRRLREAGFLTVRREEDGEHLDVAASRAWAMADHQFSHVFVRDPADVPQVAAALQTLPGIATVLDDAGKARYGMDHPRSGELVLVSEPDSWQAYYWWLDDAQAPGFARSVDIHRKPGYDPVELFWDHEARGVPLDASLVRGSHGVPVDRGDSRGALIVSEGGMLPRPGPRELTDADVANIVLAYFS